MCKVADFGLYYHNFKYGHGNAKKVSNHQLVAFQTVYCGDSSAFSNIKMHGCRLSPQGCVPVKWTAPEILFGDAAALSSKSDVYVLSLDQIAKLFTALL